jgi:CRISPR-associated protein Cas2
MSIAARLYLISYDIASPDRWRRVQKAIKGICRRNQLSVFLCRATPARIRRMETQLKRIMHHRDDRLMILDLGPAHAAGGMLKLMNPISDIADLDAVIL